MLYNVVLDVFIGLVFVFLLYSLLATIINEIIASRFALRARMLQKAMRRMLEDDLGVTDDKYDTFGIVNYFRELANNVYRFFKPFNDDPDSLLCKFYSHPSIKYLGEGRLFRKPSYLHGHNFSQTLITLLRGEHYDGSTQNESELIKGVLYDASNPLGIQPQTLRQLKMLFAESRQDSYIFKQKLEDWFEETMDRTSGWYKKQNQSILLVLGFFLAWQFNVDAIAIAKILMKDKKAREQMVQLATSRVKEYGAIMDSVDTTVYTTTILHPFDSVNKVSKDSVIRTTQYTGNRDAYLDSVNKMLQDDANAVQGILGLNGIVSTEDSSLCKQLNTYLDSSIVNEKDPARKKLLEEKRKDIYDCCLATAKKASSYQGPWYMIFFGWLLTALAISLGAPFWFDLLNKLIKLRDSGPKAKNTSAADKGNTGGGANPVKDNNNADIRG